MGEGSTLFGDEKDAVQHSTHAAANVHLH